jgi:hypothetical protein
VIIAQVSQVIVASTEPSVATWNLAKDVWYTGLVMRRHVVPQVLWPSTDIIATWSITRIASAFT